MTNKKNWLGILAIMLVFGMTVVGCDNNSTNGKNENGGNTFDATIWAQLKDTEWWLDDDAIEIGLEFKYNEFLEAPRLLFKGNDSGMNQGTIKFLSTNKIVYADVGMATNYSFNYLISNNGNTLTITNWSGSSSFQKNGIYKKVTK